MRLALVIGLLLLLFLASVTLMAQDARPKTPLPVASTAKPETPKPAPAPEPKFSELANAKILNAYHKASEAQTQVYLAQLAAQQASQAYADLVKEEVKAAGMPEGTQVKVDTQKDAVTPVLPAKK